MWTAYLEDRVMRNNASTVKNEKENMDSEHIRVCETIYSVEDKKATPVAWKPKSAWVDVMRAQQEEPHEVIIKWNDSAATQ